MPKTILAMAAVLILSAGTALTQEVTFGVKGGLSLSTLRGSFADEELANVQFDYKTGFVVGGFVAFTLGGSAILQPEFLFTRRVTNVAENSLDISTEFTFDYLEIPLLFKFSGGAGGGTSPAFYVGPAVAIQLSAKAKDPALGDEVDVSDELIGTEFGIVIGGGIDFGRRAYIDARYFWGLSNIVKDDILDTKFFDANDSFKSGVFTLMVGVGF